MVENLPANAGDTGSSPGLGRSHTPRSNWAREPQLLSLRVWSLCAATTEAATVRGPRTSMKSGPRSPQVEKALTQKRRPNTAIKKKKKKKVTNVQVQLGSLKKKRASDSRPWLRTRDTGARQPSAPPSPPASGQGSRRSRTSDASGSQREA